MKTKITPLRILRLTLHGACALLLSSFMTQFAVGGETQRWLLSVKPGFSPSDVESPGTACRWYWAEAGIAAVDSVNPDFGILAESGSVVFAVADIAVTQSRSLSAGQHLALTKGKAASKVKGTSFDAYASNYQWYWQAIGAAKPRPKLPPEWQLGTLEGSGIKIGIIDDGVPSIWDPPVWNGGAPGNPVALHPEFNEFDPAHPEQGGVVLIRDPDTGRVLNLDADQHGTAVASVLGAQHRGYGAMRGLAPKATLYCHKIDWQNYASSILEGWCKAADFGCQIINNSWYDPNLPVERYGDAVVKLPKIFRQAALELQRRGILIVAAASNDAIDAGKDSDTYYLVFQSWWGHWPDNECGFPAFTFVPQDLPNVIVVGGTGPSDYDPYASDLSKYDPWPGTPAMGQKGRAFNLDRVVNTFVSPQYGGPWVSGSTYGTFLTVVAPMGYNVKDWNAPIMTLANQLIYVACPYESLWPGSPHNANAGTSFSSPITCGIAALTAEAYYKAHGVMPTPETLAWIIKTSADDLVGPPTDDLLVWNEKALQFDFVTNVPTDQPGKDIRYGYGRVNVKKAIAEALK